MTSAVVIDTQKNHNPIKMPPQPKPIFQMEDISIGSRGAFYLLNNEIEEDFPDSSCLERALFARSPDGLTGYVTVCFRRKKLVKERVSTKPVPRIYLYSGPLVEVRADFDALVYERESAKLSRNAHVGMVYNNRFLKGCYPPSVKIV
jgi:hypothetical protein